MEGPSCPVLFVQHSSEGNGLSTEERMEKVTCSEGFLKPPISCGGSSASSPRSARGLDRDDCVLGSELREPRGGRLTQQAIMVGLPC